MNIHFVTQWYAPERGSGMLPQTIAKALRGLGHSVEVLTGLPNYPTGKLYPGYTIRAYQREHRDNMVIHRVALYMNHSNRPIKRITNYLTFAVVASLTAVFTGRKADAVLVYSSPITAALPAMVLRAVYGIPFVLLVQDMWPQSVTESGLVGPTGRRLENLLNRFCDSIYRQADTIAVTSPGMANLIEKRNIKRQKIVFAPNWVDESSFHPAAVSVDFVLRTDVRRQFNVMYAGNMGEMQGLEVVLQAAELLLERKDVGFILVGGGVSEKRLRGQAELRELDNVRFLGHQPPAVMAGVLARGDAQLITLLDRPLFAFTLPSKLQVALAAGRPIIAAVSGDAAKVVHASGSGLVVMPQDGVALAGAVDAMSRMSLESRRQLGKSGRAYYEKEFGEGVGAARLAGLLQAAANRVDKP